jgi:hypothetical protein
MKKAPLSANHQTRRKAAWQRFSVRAKTPEESQTQYDAYLKRKQIEQTSLNARLGGQS